MKKNRCPWCGKKNHSFSYYQNSKSQREPFSLNFEQCAYCNNYYGQYNRKKRYLICFLIGMLVFGIGYSLHHISISALSVIFFIIAFIAPTEKLTEEGHRVKPDEALLIKLTIIDGKIKKNNLYFFTKDFDIYEAYSVVAPIQIVSFNKSDNSFIGYFLYEHPQNYQHTNTEHEIYDSSMKCVAKIKILF